MASEYDPFFQRSSDRERSRHDDWSSDETSVPSLESVQAAFLVASRPYLTSPWSWLAWAILLPIASLSTAPVHAAGGLSKALLLWSVTVIIGGIFEVLMIRRHSQEMANIPRSGLATWALRAQANLSLVAVAITAVLIWTDTLWPLPGCWLLLLGHQLYSLGGLSFKALRTCGLIYQTGGLLALIPGLADLPYLSGLSILALATGLGNGWIAWAVWRRSRSATTAR